MVRSIFTNAGAMVALQALAQRTHNDMQTIADQHKDIDAIGEAKRRAYADERRAEIAPTVQTARGTTSRHGRTDADLARLARAEQKRQRKLAKNRPTPAKGEGGEK